MATYTTIDDIINLWRPLTPEESQRASYLLPTVEDKFRMYATQRGLDLDAMITSGEILPTVFKSVVSQVVVRTLNQDTAGEAMSQMSQSVGGYSVSGTFLSAGTDIYIKRSEYAALGLRRQRVEALELFGSPYPRW